MVENHPGILKVIEMLFLIISFCNVYENLILNFINSRYINGISWSLLSISFIIKKIIFYLIY